MSELEDLKPLKKPRICDLVQEAGLDVTEWANYPGGVRRAAANPKYCYEWAFVQPGRIVILNLWYSQLKEEGGRVVWTENLQAWHDRHSRPDTKPIWRRRAAAFENAIIRAVTESLTVRAIINDGQVRPEASRHTTASKVRHRLLDPAPWAVTSYDRRTGNCTLTRGLSPRGSVDQFDLDELSNCKPEQKMIQTKAFSRDRAVREAAQLRARGRCEFCSHLGFVREDGRIYIETHHVFSLAQGGRDSIDNVVALCPNHHREAHHGAGADAMRERLVVYLRRWAKDQSRVGHPRSSGSA